MVNRITDALSNCCVITVGSGNNFPNSLNSVFSFSRLVRAAVLLFSFIAAINSGSVRIKRNSHYYHALFFIEFNLLIEYFVNFKESMRNVNFYRPVMSIFLVFLKQKQLQPLSIFYDNGSTNKLGRATNHQSCLTRPRSISFSNYVSYSCLARRSDYKELSWPHVISNAPDRKLNRKLFQVIHKP